MPRVPIDSGRVNLEAEAAAGRVPLTVTADHHDDWRAFERRPPARPAPQPPKMTPQPRQSN